MNNESIKNIKECIKNNKKIVKIIFTILYLIMFILLARIVCINHEFWDDEAQSILIARDNNFVDIIKAVRYEGSPALWHFLVKIFLLLGFKVENIYLLTITLTSIGIIFLFKNKDIPIFLKLTLPFSYYIFFQYTVIARSYCLLFPLLMMIAYIYPDKDKKLVRYAILLILLMNVSAHSFLIAGGLWFEFLLEKIIKLISKKEKLEKRHIIFFSILAIFFLMTILYIFPTSDNSYSMSTRFYPNLVMARSLYINSDNKYLNAIGALLFGFVMILIIYSKDIKILLNNLLKIVVLLLPNLFFICLFVCHGEWHMGILFLILIFLAIILKSLQKNKILYAMIFVLMIMQVYWAYDTSMYDINNEFSSGEAASNYIKEIGYENKTICAVDYWSVQVNIYFDENINTNYAESKAYFPWKKEYADYIFSNNIIKNDELYDIYIIPKIYFYKYETNGKDYYMDTNNYFDFENLIRKNLLNTGLYEEKYFESNMYAKGKLVENTGLYVLVRKD